MAQHLHLGGNDIQLFGDLLADALQCGAIVRTDLLGFGQVVQHIYPLDVVGQRLSAGFLAAVSRDGEVVISGLRIGLIFSGCLNLVKQAELVRSVLLRGGAETLGDQGVELLTKEGVFILVFAYRSLLLCN
jgi:hypothetical protein